MAGKRGKHRRKKKKTHKKGLEIEAEKNKHKRIPKSFVMRKGAANKYVRQLVLDTRAVMEPHTAANLKEKKANELEDFVNIAGPLGVTHFMIFSATQSSTYLRILKSPQGPTLTFSIKQFMLASDVSRLQARPHSMSYELQCPPLVVRSNMSSSESHIKLMSTMFESLFCPINPRTLKLAECRRVVLFQYDEKNDVVEFRHYVITIVPHGASKSVKKLVGKKIPNLGDYEDIADYIKSGAMGTESDAEDASMGANVTLPQDVSKRSTENQQSAVRLKEIGPRMQLKLWKIEEGLCCGDILYAQNDAAAATYIPPRRKKKRKLSEEPQEGESGDKDGADKEGKRVLADEEGILDAAPMRKRNKKSARAATSGGAGAKASKSDAPRAKATFRGVQVKVGVGRKRTRMAMEGAPSKKGKPTMPSRSKRRKKSNNALD